jgi:hypothetical protein
MQIKDFKATVLTFADPGSEILFEGPKLLVSVNDELIEAKLSATAGDVSVDEGDGPIAASAWIVKRLARLPLLASRLIETVPPTKFFVPPAAALLPSLERKPDETVTETSDAVCATLDALREPSPLETTVLYVTSDAGEGKTSLINELAREQANRFLQHEAEWLLIPIPLGGRHFLRFDDITVGVLQNRYRFSALYYDSFLCLVRMGVIVPAFDGFEEMFVENSSGEALSAMGILLGHLDSRGAMIIAARKAYFEFENLKTQERLYDSIRGYAVGFAKLELHRWSKEQFLSYGDKRGIADPVTVYNRVSERLGPTHSLLTRPVLVRRLVDIAIETSSLDSFLERIHASGADFFSVFVRGIVEREAHEKWVDRSGEIGTPLLTVDEHCELLAQVALAMWDARVDYLKQDLLEFVTDYFTEIKRKSAFQAQQIRERMRGHALLIPSPNAAKAVEFDHEEFRLFFLGEGLAAQLRPLNEKAKADVLSTLRKAVLPRHSQRAFIRAVTRDPKLGRLDAAKFLLGIASLDGQASYTQENCSALIVRLLREIDGKGVELGHLAFGPDSLRDRDLLNVTFKNCYFSGTSLETSRFRNCTFLGCTFAQLRVFDSTRFQNVSFTDCTIDSLQIQSRNVDVWDPQTISTLLQQLGVTITSTAAASAQPQTTEPREADAELQALDKLVRYFMRSTHISESVIAMKLGNRARMFMDNTVPELLRRGVLLTVENRGGGQQRRFRLGLPLRDVNRAMTAAGGSYQRFLALVNQASTDANES